MLKIAAGIFLILHGLVHGLYAGHSFGVFELQPGLRWPEESWLLRTFFSRRSIRYLGGALLVLAGMGFLGSGAGFLLSAGWWRGLLFLSTGISSGIYVLFWNGHFSQLPDQGLIGLLINSGILLLLFLGS
jgi:hypothetical protein